MCLDAEDAFGLATQHTLFGHALELLRENSYMLNQVLEVFREADGGIYWARYELPGGFGPAAG